MRADLHRFLYLVKASLVVATLALVPSFAQASTSWLYAVERPVEAQTDAERQRAAREGLLIVLSRITGLASVPRTPEVSAALQRPDRYYNEFVFRERRDALNEVTLSVTLTYQADAVIALCKQAALPVWWSRRPQVVAWVVEDGGEREVLGSGSEHPVTEALVERAQFRGVPLTLPLMDLDDSLAVSAADVWGKVSQTLDAAAARYGADLVLTGRLRGMPGVDDMTTNYRGDWEIWLDGAPLVEKFTGVDAATAAAMAVDLIADRLAERYAVLPRSVRAQRVSVVGLAGPEAYADMMRYLGSLEFIDRVDVVALSDNSLQLQVASRARAEQLLMLLTAEDKLREDKFHRGLDVQLVWRG